MQIQCNTKRYCWRPPEKPYRPSGGGRNYSLSLKVEMESYPDDFVWIHRNNHNFVFPGQILYPQNFVACRYHRRASLPELTFITHVLYTLKKLVYFLLDICHCPGLPQASNESAVSMETPLTHSSPGLKSVPNILYLFFKKLPNYNFISAWQCG